MTRILGAFYNYLLIAEETPFHLDFRFCEMCRLFATRAGGGRISVDASSQESSLEHDNGGTEEGENGSNEDGYAGIPLIDSDAKAVPLDHDVSLGTMKPRRNILTV